MDYLVRAAWKSVTAGHEDAPQITSNEVCPNRVAFSRAIILGIIDWAGDRSSDSQVRLMGTLVCGKG